MGERDQGSRARDVELPRLRRTATETILLGNLAVWVGDGKRVEWDAKKLKSTNMPELASFVKREYRQGYSI